LGNLGVALYHGPTPVADAIAQCESLLREYDGDRASEANIYLWMGALEAMRGAFHDGRAYLARAESTYEDLGLPTAVTDLCGHVRGAIEMLAGNPADAEQALRRSCEMLRQLHLTARLATVAGELADAIYEQGRYEEAESWTMVARDSEGTEDLDAKLSWQPVQAKILARRGSFEAAELLGREALALVSQTDALNRHAASLLVLAEILRLSGHPEETAELVGEALTLYELKGNVVAADRTRALLVEAAVVE
jgi:tetratricopeptide (TPR) repeat protein